MKIDNSFAVHAPVSEAWRILLDVQRVVACIPGAELLEARGDQSYRGRVSVKLGPVALTFEGAARFVEINESDYRAKIEAKGTDKGGRGGANAKVVFQLQPRDGATTVLIETDLNLFGAVAQYGRGAGVIADVADYIVEQFAACLAKQIAASGGVAGQPAAAPAGNRPIAGLRLGMWLAWRAFLAFFRRLAGKA